MEKHEELLKFYRVYIDDCIENTTEKDPIYPMSFVKWVGIVYIPLKDSMKKLLKKEGLVIKQSEGGE